MVTLATLERQYRAAKVVLPDGMRLNVVQAGPADGPAVIMLHGIADSWFSFSRVLPLMPAHFRVVAVDQRGHGDSDRPASGYSMDAFASDLLSLMDGLRIERATIVGHSMGSFIARRAAERARDRIERLVLVGTAMTPQNDVIRSLMDAANTLSDPVDTAFIRGFQASTIGSPVPHAFFKQVVAESCKLPADVWRQSARGLLDYQPQWPITCRTTILGGELDTVFSSGEQTAVFLATERSTLHLEPGVGHALHWEMPEKFVSLAFAGA